MIKRDKCQTNSGRVVTKQDITAAILKCAKKLERVPTYTELRKMTRVTVNGIRKHFGTFTRALRTAELQVGHAGVTSTMKDLFNDWATVARGAVPGAVWETEDEELLNAIRWQLQQLADRGNSEGAEPRSLADPAAGATGTAIDNDSGS